jgi:tetratricopeptide (TPR) repeat protein
MAYKIKVASRPVTDEQAALHWLDRWVIWEAKQRRWLWPLVIGLLVLGLIGGAGGGWWWWQNHQAVLLAGQAAEFYPAPTEAASPTPEGQKKPAVADQCAKALPLYQQITERYGHSRLAPLAGYYQANCQVELGKTDDAIALYKRIVGQYGLTNESAQLAALRLGYLYAGRGDRAQAIEQFQNLSRESTALNRDQALFEVGRLQEEGSNRDAALTAYRSVQKDFPKSPWSSEAATRIKALGGETPTPEAAPSALPPAAATPAQPGTAAPSAPASTPATGGK